MSADFLTKLQTTDPHLVKAYVATVTAVDAANGLCTVDIGDGDPLAEVPYWGGAPGVGSVQVALLFDTLLGILTAGGVGSAPVTDPALPDPVSASQGDIVITTSTRHQEPATSTRLSITNPHPTKKMLVAGYAMCWQAITGMSAGGDVYLDIDPLGSTMDEAGTPPTIPTHVRWMVPQSVGATAMQTAQAQGYYSVPPASTGTLYSSGAKVGGTLTYTMRSNIQTLVPIRYQ